MMMLAHAMYRPGIDCPNCGRRQWIVGRATAECAFCATALPLRNANPADAPVIEHANRGKGRKL